MPPLALSPEAEAATEIWQDGIDAETALCARQFFEFLSFVRIRSNDPLHPELFPLAPYPYQAELGQRWQDHESMVILKARQVGCSTVLKAYALWRMIYFGWNIGYYSKGDDESVAWMTSETDWGVHQMALALPPHILHPANVHRSGDVLRVGKGSIRVFPGSQKGGVGYTFQLVIADEAAHHPYGRENYANYEPTLSGGSQFICLSTADPSLGPSGWFYEMWQQAQDGGPYAAVFLGWNEVPARDDAWYEERRQRSKGNEAALRANYPERPEDAFVGREGLVFPMYDRERHIRTAPVPWEETLRRYCATDYGGGDPTAAPVGGVWRRAGEGFSRIHIYDAGYWKKGAPSVEEIGGFLGKWHARARFSAGEGDPAPGGEVINESLRAIYGLPFRRGNAKRGEGLGLVAQYLENGWLTFDASLLELVESEIRSYRWAEKVDPNNHERYATKRVVDNHADLLDAVRLLVMGVYYDELSTRPRQAYSGVQW